MEYLYSSSFVKNSIVNSTIYLLNECKIDKIRISSVCRKSNISRTNFYYYFDSINEVVLYIIDLLKEEINNTITCFECDDSYLCEVVCFFEVVKKYNSVFLVLFNSNNIDVFKELDGFIQKKYSTIIMKIRSRNALKKDIYYDEKNDYLMQYRRFGTMNIIKKWVNNGCLESPTKIATLVLDCNNYF